jgi:hypothetical protein
MSSELVVSCLMSPFCGRPSIQTGSVMNRQQKRLLTSSAAISIAAWLMSAGTTTATSASTGPEAALCGMISSTAYTTGFAGDVEELPTADEAAEAMLDSTFAGDAPEGDVSTVVVEGDTARVAVTDESGDVSHLVEVEQNSDGGWNAEIVNECMDGAFSPVEVVERAENTPWYTGVWHNNVAPNYRIDNNVPVVWREAVQAGVSNYSDRAGGNGPDFNYTGLVRGTNDGYACDNPTNIIYGHPNLVGALGVTNVCYVRPDDPRQTTYISRMQITMAMGIPGGWHTGADHPGDKWDLRSIVTHEAGHATGFYGHFVNDGPKCPVPRTAETATMCPGAPGIQGTAWLRTLASADLAAINNAY